MNAIRITDECKRIIQDHLINGRVVEQYVLAVNSMKGEGPESGGA